MGEPGTFPAGPQNSPALRVLVAHDLAEVSDPMRPGPHLSNALKRVPGTKISVVDPQWSLAEAGSRCEVLVLGAQSFGAAEVEAEESLSLRVLARHGAGFDSVDIDAMTHSGVMVINTPKAVQRPVALMVITFALALAQSLIAKDRLTREGRWHERGLHIGPGFTAKTLGIIGAGGIGQETARLAEALGLKVVVARSDRNASLAGQGLTLCDLEEVLGVSDFLVLTCRLSSETLHLVNAERLRRMKPTAFLINVARGAVVDELALIGALKAGVIAGAGLDVFESEPVDPANPLLQMDNVVLAPHALCVTEETLNAIAIELADGLAAITAHQSPENLINPEVLTHPRVKEWLRAS